MVNCSACVSAPCADVGLDSKFLSSGPLRRPEPLESAPTPGEDPASRFIRLLTVFLLAMWVGFEVITKVPQRLHTPLTSGSNAISGVTVVGALVVAGSLTTGFGTLFGLMAVLLAMINVAGGFVVTHRMLEMFNVRHFFSSEI